MAEADLTNESIDRATTWPDLAIGLYDRLTGRGAEISYKFDRMTVQLPSGPGSDADHIEW